MSKTINDLVVETLRAEGYTGTYNDMYRAWLADQGFTGAFTDAHKAWLRDQGFFSEAEYLRDAGYSGALNDMQKAALIDGNYFGGGGGGAGPSSFDMVHYIASSNFGNSNITMNTDLSGMDASDKLVVALVNIVHFSAGAFGSVYLNEVLGTILVQDTADGGAGESSAIIYWKDADVPSEDGIYALRVSLGQKLLYGAGVYVFADVNQADPFGYSGALVDTAVSNGQDFDMTVPSEVGSPIILSLGLGDLNPPNPPAITFSENLTELEQEWIEHPGDGWAFGQGYSYGKVAETSEVFTATNSTGNGMDIGIALAATINLN